MLGPCLRFYSFCDFSTYEKHLSANSIIFVNSFYVLLVVLERYLVDYFETKTLYFWSSLIYAISVGLLYFQTNIYIIYGLSSVFGIMLNIYLVLPYQMISEFHQCDVYRSKSSEGTKRGIGSLKEFFLIVLLPSF